MDVMLTGLGTRPVMAPRSPHRLGRWRYHLVDNAALLVYVAGLDNSNVTKRQEFCNIYLHQGAGRRLGRGRYRRSGLDRGQTVPIPGKNGSALLAIVGLRAGIDGGAKIALAPSPTALPAIMQGMVADRSPPGLTAARNNCHFREPRLLRRAIRSCFGIIAERDRNMTWLATRLRIGEKLFVGFGAVGLIFLGVIGYYHVNLRDIVSAYQGLQTVYGARQAHAFVIESRLTAMRSSADGFLLSRDPAAAERALLQADALRAEAAELATIDAASARTAESIRRLTDEFVSRFEEIVEAWRVRGLDEDSGLQGAFREAVHELEDRAGHYNVDRLYLLLLQVRRGEKDLGLRREARYRDRVHRLLDEMQAVVDASDLRADTKAALVHEVTAYRKHFDTYAADVLAGAPTDGGKGPFRDTAHRIEGLLEAHYIRDLEAEILQMRRREKDYLLRGDDRYVTMVDAIAEEINARISASEVGEEEQEALRELLTQYRRDFHALVDQNRRIAELSEAMYAAADRVTPLVEANLGEAIEAMESNSNEIETASARRAAWSLTVAAIAPVLGALLALLITAGIVRPVRRMAGLLDRLTRESPRERIETDPRGRDEINAMAIALNTMADHRARFNDWWRSSMQEAVACRDLDRAQSDDERIEAALELRDAASARLEQITAEGERLSADADRLERLAATLPEDAEGRDSAAALRSIAGDLRTLLAIAKGG
jgi:CHASE3 domain sensor protein